ncbi:MAG: glycosyltransferase family 4 protein [Bacteroidetes bacterium]|nr:glycosyltransferase family 4 protein [Bacteroidota bacterium]
MKVLYITQHFNIPTGSAGIRLYKMAKALVDHGHEVTIVCGSYDGAKTGLDGEFIKGKRTGFYEGIKIIEFDIKYSNKFSFAKRAGVFFLYVWKTVGLALFYEYDILFASTTPLTVGVPGIFARWIRGKKFVFEVRDLWPELPKAMGVIKNPVILWLMGVLEFLCYRSATKLIGLSEGIVKGIERRGVKKNKIANIPNGCDLDIFSANDGKLKIKGVQENDFLCLYSGTHGIANGLDILIGVAAELTRRGNNNIKFVLVGDGKLKPGLIAKANEQNLKNIIFLDPLNKADLSKLMNTCNIGMQLLANIPAFYYGTSPNKFFDYISAGLPVLNNYPGWISELITQNNCGITVSPDNPVAFADSLIKLEQEKFKLPEMSVNASKLAKHEFDRILLSDKWVNWVTS